MRVIKLAVISFSIIFLIVTAISLMIPSQVRISRAVDIDASSEEIFALIKDHSKWQLWHPAYQQPSEQMSQISRSQIASTDSSYILQLQQQGRKAVMSGWVLHRYHHTTSVTLQWYMDFKLNWYPWEKFTSMFYEKTFGAMMEQGLAKLKEQVTQSTP